MSVPAPRRSLPLNLLTGGRTVVAAITLLTPRVGARMFRMDAEGTPAIVMGRMFGVRNAALALGLLRLDTTTVPRSFMSINVLIDVVDAAAMVVAGRRGEISTTTTVLGTGVALSAAGLGAAALAALPPPDHIEQRMS